MPAVHWSGATPLTLFSAHPCNEIKPLLLACLSLSLSLQSNPISRPPPFPLLCLARPRHPPLPFPFPDFIYPPRPCTRQPDLLCLYTYKRTHIDRLPGLSIPSSLLSLALTHDPIRFFPSSTPRRLLEHKGPSPIRLLSINRSILRHLPRLSPACVHPPVTRNLRCPALRETWPAYNRLPKRGHFRKQVHHPTRLERGGIYALVGDSGTLRFPGYAIQSWTAISASGPAAHSSLTKEITSHGSSRTS